MAHLYVNQGFYIKRNRNTDPKNPILRTLLERGLANCSQRHFCTVLELRMVFSVKHTHRHRHNTQNTCQDRIWPLKPKCHHLTLFRKLPALELENKLQTKITRQTLVGELVLSIKHIATFGVGPG